MKTAFPALLASLALLIGGCAPKQKAADVLTPIARETAIVLNVSDKRDSTSVVLQTGGGTAGITDVNLMAVVEKSVRATFFEKGYRLVSRGDAHAARVDVALRLFRLEIKKKLVTEKEQVTTEIVVTARRGGKTLKKTYRASTEKRALKTSKESFEKKIRVAAGKVLRQVARDAELERFIVRGS